MTTHHWCWIVKLNADAHMPHILAWLKCYSQVIQHLPCWLQSNDWKSVKDFVTTKNSYCVGKYKEIHFPNTDGTNWVQWHVEASRPTPNTCRDTDAASVGAHRLLYHASKSPCCHCLLTDEEKGWPSPPRKKNIQNKSGPGSAAANWIWFERLQIAASVWRFFFTCIPTNRNIKTHQPDAAKPFALSFITTLVDWWGVRVHQGVLKCIIRLIRKSFAALDW